MTKFTINVVDFTPTRRGTLRGWCNARVDELKLIIFDIAVRQGADGSRWVDLPARPLLDDDGVARRTPEGRIEYVPLFVFDTPAAEAFSRVTVNALLRFDPHAFDEAAA